MSRRRGFEFRVVPTLLVTLLFALLIALGTWQLDRAQQKRELLMAYDARATPQAWRDLTRTPARYTRVRLHGHYDAQRQVLMEGITHKGRPGYYVLTPLRTAGGGWVMVNRGWLPWTSTRDAVAPPPVPDGALQVIGRVTRFAEPGMRLGDGNVAAGWPRLAVYPSATEIGQWLGSPVAAAVLLLDPQLDGGFVREWRPDTIPPSRHVGYAVQWYGLAVALLILFLLVSRQSPREDDDSQSRS